jgi:predicted nucleic acid-binding protein
VSPVSYWDASALVKLVIDEADSTATAAAFEAADRVATSRVGVVETARATARRSGGNAERLREILASLEIIELDPIIAARAASLMPPEMRTLDAIHLATALELGAELAAIVTYDGRLAEAARARELPVLSPA